jgi:hypothetical protein
LSELIANCRVSERMTDTPSNDVGRERQRRCSLRKGFSDRARAQPQPRTGNHLGDPINVRRSIPSAACLTLLPAGCTSVAAAVSRSTVRPAQRMGDTCRQVSWLAARTLPTSLPDRTYGSVSGIRGESLPLTVAGAATAPGCNCIHDPCSLFTGARFVRRNRHELELEQGRARASRYARLKPSSCA